MTIRIDDQPDQRRDRDCVRPPTGDAQWPHVGECALPAWRRDRRMVKQRDGGRVSAAGDAM